MKLGVVLGEEKVGGPSLPAQYPPNPKSPQNASVEGSTIGETPQNSFFKFKVRTARKWPAHWMASSQQSQEGWHRVKPMKHKSAGQKIREQEETRRRRDI